MKLTANENNQRFIQRLAELGRLPHAFLIEAPAGGGKKTFARFIGAAALCTAQTSKPCGKCAACEKIQRDIHPDVMWYTVPEGKRDFPVAHVREIGENLQIAPSEGLKKVYILDKAHTMNTSSQNAMLKMIEEPPPFVMFILLVENKAAMLETVRSRVRSIGLRIPTADQCLSVLRERMPDKAENLLAGAAQSAGGNVGCALELLEQAKPSRGAADCNRLMEAFLLKGRYDALGILSAYDKERQPLLELLSLLERELGLLALGKSSFTARGVLPKRAMAAAGAVNEAAAFMRGNGHIGLGCCRMTEQIFLALNG